MANPEHLAFLKEGFEVWGRWRNNHERVRPDLCGADLSCRNLCGCDLNSAKLIGTNLSQSKLSNSSLRGADLVGADLTYADLRGASLRQSNLSGANLSKALIRHGDLSDADLSGANLSNAILSETNLMEADLRNASLRGADLSAANLSWAKLDLADIAGANIGYTILAHVNLSKVKGLETVRHEGPSTVGIDTIYISEGRIPHIFLRGAGVPENFISYMASLVCVGIEFYSLFISYSTNDQEFADRLHDDLQAKGVRCWFAPHDVKAGEKLDEQIDEAIRLHDKLLLILSPDSIKSEWVKTEISKARKREVRENKRVLFPIRLCTFAELRDWECFDSDAGKDSAREIREYFIPDFSNWKDHDAYKLAFDRLLKDLQDRAAPVARP
jgi:hypothetical protein